MARFAVLGYGPFQFRQLYEWMKLSRNLLYLCSVICCILIVSKLLQQLELWIEQQIKQDAENYPLQSSFPILYPWPQNKSANSLLHRSRSWRKGRKGRGRNDAESWLHQILRPQLEEVCIESNSNRTMDKIDALLHFFFPFVFIFVFGFICLMICLQFGQVSALTSCHLLYDKILY